MFYIENPKTKGSGIKCCIPQQGACPVKCSDCFFQSGRSYLEPLTKTLPNMPSSDGLSFEVVRVNDGNDSTHQIDKVIKDTSRYSLKFYNTSIPTCLEKFDAPIVLTVNPGEMTDKEAHLLEIVPSNLMFIRFRTNMWNLTLLDKVVQHYTSKEIPVVLTFMAYFSDSVRTGYEKDYVFRNRTTNSYHAITTDAWRWVMKQYENNKWVYSCGKIEGEFGDTKCRFCGNCLREFFATMTRMKEIDYNLIKES